MSGDMPAGATTEEYDRLMDESGGDATTCPICRWTYPDWCWEEQGGDCPHCVSLADENHTIVVIGPMPFGDTITVGPMPTEENDIDDIEF